VTLVIDEGFYHMDFVAVIAYISSKYMFYYPGDINQRNSATATSDHCNDTSDSINDEKVLDT